VSDDLIGEDWNYHVITVTEGGADFDDFSLDEILGCYRSFSNPYQKWTQEKWTSQIMALRLGDTMSLNGCSKLYVLRKH
jgi:hypothetical protein